MKIHVDVARYGNERTEITMHLPERTDLANNIIVIKRLQEAFPEAEFDIDETGLGAAVVDAMRAA